MWPDPALLLGPRGLAGAAQCQHWRVTAVDVSGAREAAPLVLRTPHRPRAGLGSTERSTSTPWPSESSPGDPAVLRPPGPAGMSSLLQETQIRGPACFQGTWLQTDLQLRCLTQPEAKGGEVQGFQWETGVARPHLGIPPTHKGSPEATLWHSLG